ncbi:MAG: DUF1223 domain-containing protein [Hydrogenophaga sp.]|uniref:DUF1223 domain-containing protein n=1 Tax=Hydrogenophaga sp. TaxID=1904254 RepID=UPI001D8399A1|nr:DUF1223 domain-containing protein [Hydrogenophaga sp.]MBX3610433.1 DUF1223 domain-containing protein [Hydrogenophaga sp.]
MSTLFQRALLGLLAVSAGGAGAADVRCEASRGTQAPAIVELYTSEGCSSCPPADRWLSGLKGQDDVVALSFHVNYWNHLGWRDPFATAATTERQYRLRDTLGGRTVYTPQVVLNGRDDRDWYRQKSNELPRLGGQAPAIRLTREGDDLIARVERKGDAPGRLAGYWALLQDGVSSRVTAGENAGEQLHHDHVVVHYQPVAAWSGSDAHTERWYLPLKIAHRVAFVVTDTSLTRPVQAVVMRCPG